MRSIGHHRSGIYIELVVENSMRFNDERIVTVLLKLISHPLQTVREKTLQQLRQTLSSVIQEITDNGDSFRSNKLKFLVTHRVLDELVTHRLDDASHSVANNAGSIVATLITSQMLWSDDVKSCIFDSFDQLMPYLETFQESDKLGVALREFTFAPRRAKLDRLKSALRMLLHRKRENRRKVLNASLDTFSALFDGRDMSSFVDYFIVQSPIDLNEQRMMENVFRVDSIGRLTKIIQSEHVEPGLKYSAYSQLAVVTVEMELVTIFVQDAGYQFLLNELESLASQSALTPDEKEAAGSVCDIFRHIIAVHAHIATSLSNNETLLTNLVRLVEHTSLSPPQHRRVTAFLYVLLYLPICSFDERGLITTSGLVSKRVQLPFIVEFAPPISEHFDREYKPEHNLLNHQAAQRTLRLAWNAANMPKGSDFADELKKTDFDFQFWPKFDILANAEKICSTLQDRVG